MFWTDDGWYDTSMGNHFDAIYENGVLRPLQPLELPDQSRVEVTVRPAAVNREPADGSSLFPTFTPPDAARPLTAEAVQRALEETP